MMNSFSEQLLHRIRDAHKRRKLTWWERMYLPAIAQGLWVTSVHFWRNLFLHIAHRVGLYRDVPAAVTIQYPDERRTTALRLRTRHRLTKREDGTPRWPFATTEDPDGCGVSHAPVRFQER